MRPSDRTRTELGEQDLSGNRGLCRLSVKAHAVNGLSKPAHPVVNTLAATESVE